jgi:hypothetical protein
MYNFFPSRGFSEPIILCNPKMTFPTTSALLAFMEYYHSRGNAKLSVFSQLKAHFST